MSGLQNPESGTKVRMRFYSETQYDLETEEVDSETNHVSETQTSDSETTRNMIRR